MKDVSAKKVASSSSWSVIAALTDKAAVLIVYVVLARYIGKEEFGYIALMLLIIDFVNFLSGMGIREKLVTYPEWEARHTNSGFWLLMGLTTSFCLLLFIFTFFLKAPLEHYLSVELIQAICVIPFISSLNVVQLAKLQREMQFKTLAIRSLITTVIATVVAIVMVVKGFGVWSFVVYKYVYVTMNTIILWKLSKYRPSIEFDIGLAKDFLKYGAPIVATGMVYLSNRKLMEMIVTPFLGIKKLGELDIGKKLPETVYQITMAPLNAVGLSYYSKVSSKSKTYCDYNAALSLAVLPIVLSLGFFAEDVIRIVFGADKVDVSAGILEIVAFGAFAAIYNSSLQSFLISLAQQSLNFYLVVTELVVVLIASSLFIDMGVLAFVTAYTVSTSSVVVVKFLVIKRWLDFDLKYLLSSLLRPWCAAALLYASYYIFSNMVFSFDPDNHDLLYVLIKLFSIVSVGLLIYLVCVAVMYWSQLGVLLQRFRT